MKSQKIQSKETIEETKSLCEPYFQLSSAILLQAIKDYFDDDPTVTEQTRENRRKKIIKDLGSKWMYEIAGENSLIARDKLLNNPEELRARVKRDELDYE